MNLEAVWYKDGKEIYKVCPVTNIVCDENMKSIADIEIESAYKWHSCSDADNFVVRLVKGE
jgi:hypothetical protein